MKRYLPILGLLLFASMLSTPVQAQQRKAPAATTTVEQQKEVNWTGFYVAAEAGWSFAQSDLGISGTPFSVNGLGSDGAIGCFTAGFDQQIGKFVGGLFGSYCLQETEFSVQPALFNAKLGNSWSGGGRLGIAWGNALPYIMAAYTQTEHEVQIVGVTVASPDLTGYTLGCGVDFKITESWSAGLNYGWTHYNTEDYGTGGLLAVDTDQHRVLFRVRYQIPSFN